MTPVSASSIGLPSIGPVSGVIPLPPLLAEATLLFRASEYSGSGDWLNEGTGGSAYDATPTVTPGEGEDIDPVTDPGGIILGNNAAFEGDHGADLVIGEDDSISVLYLGTPHADSGFPGIAGYGVGKIDTVNSGGWGGPIDISSVFGPPGFGVAFKDGNDVAPWPRVASPDADELILVVGVLDRSDDTSYLYLNDVEVGTADQSATGALTNTNGFHIPGLAGAAHTLRATGMWRRALTASEVTVDLPTALGV